MSELRRLRLCVTLTFHPVAVVVAARSVAQDEPKGAGKEPAKKPAAKAPAAKPPAAKPPADQAPAAKVAAPAGDAASSEQPKQEAPPPETDPFVLAVLEVKPTTPEQWFRTSKR